MGGIIIGALLGLYIGENAEGSLKARHGRGGLPAPYLRPDHLLPGAPGHRGFITPAIVRLGQNASKILLVAVALAYVSSLARPCSP